MLHYLITKVTKIRKLIFSLCFCQTNSRYQKASPPQQKQFLLQIIQKLYKQCCAPYDMYMDGIPQIHFPGALWFGLNCSDPLVLSTPNAAHMSQPMSYWFSVSSFLGIWLQQLKKKWAELRCIYLYQKYLFNQLEIAANFWLMHHSRYSMCTRISLSYFTVRESILEQGAIKWSAKGIGILW